MFTEVTSNELILFFILYGITGTVPAIAAIYLLLRRGNAFAPEVTPPVRLRRWAATFFAVSALAHVWWYLFYVYSCDINSVAYVTVVVLDCATQLVTIAGMLLAMLQDRRRPVWPAFAAMIPLVVLGVLQALYPKGPFENIAGIYILSFYLLFSIYMVFAVRQYGRWLNDNYADLEHKKVWLTQMVSLGCLLLFILYSLSDINNILIYVLHFVELVLFILLLWRVETLPQLETILVEKENSPPTSEKSSEPDADKTDVGNFLNINLVQIEEMLSKNCVDTQLYLQHDLTLQQLAHSIGTNRSYLSHYFARQGITYNIYINNLRINHFISRYQEAASTGQAFTVQQLASESGYHSYSTFSLAFKQRFGQNVTEWMRDAGDKQ